MHLTTKNRGHMSCIEWHQVRSGYCLGSDNVLESFFRSVLLTSSCKPHRKSCIWLLAEWKHCWGYVHVEHWGLLCTLYCFWMVLYHSLVFLHIFHIYSFCGLGVFFVFCFLPMVIGANCGLLWFMYWSLHGFGSWGEVNKGFFFSYLSLSLSLKEKDNKP